MVSTWRVRFKPRAARTSLEDLMVRCVAYVFRHVNAEMIHDPNTGSRFRVTLDGPKSEPFAKVADKGPRSFDVLWEGREMVVVSLDPDSLTYAVAEGWANACARAWGTKVTT